MKIFRHLLLRQRDQRDLILTTFPSHKSANVGDKLIAESFIEIAQHLKIVNQVETLFRGTPLRKANLAPYTGRPVFLPGMSVSNDLYPLLYPLTKDPYAIVKRLVPFGCTWQHPIGLIEHAEQAKLTDPTLSLLNAMVDATGPIAVRDNMAATMLARNGIGAIVVGDCAWYHLPSRRKSMKRPNDIQRIAITTPHNFKLTEQSIEVINVVRSLFPTAHISLVLHSNPLSHTNEIAAHAARQQIEIIQTSGDTSIFERYAEFDLHVGHRLHGHIGFLRRRIPSVLFIEDARSRGFSTSISTGCFSAMVPKTTPEDVASLPIEKAKLLMVPDKNVVQRAAEFINQEILSGFLRYIGIPTYIDHMLEEVVLPTLADKVARTRRV